MSRALIVDDESRWCAVWKDVFGGMNMEAEAARGIDEARALLEAGHYDFVVLDVCLIPEDESTYDSQRLLLQLRREQPNVPVIVTTGKALSWQDGFEFAKLGASECVYKPSFNVRKLEMDIRRIVLESRLNELGAHGDAALAEVLKALAQAVWDEQTLDDKTKARLVDNLSRASHPPGGQARYRRLRRAVSGIVAVTVTGTKLHDAWVAWRPAIERLLPH